MSLKVSINSRNLSVLALAASVSGGHISIYGSTSSQAAADALIPATADAAVAGTLLNTISESDSGTGITMETTATNGIVSKTTSETWMGTNLATGYASYYRYALIGDSGAANSDEPRIQGTVGTVGTDIVIASSLLTISEEQRLDSYVLGQPGA